MKNIWGELSLIAVMGFLVPVGVCAGPKATAKPLWKGVYPPYEMFVKWPREKQVAFDQGVMDSVYQLEKAISFDEKLARQSGRDWMAWLIEEAVAWDPKKCLIGGVRLRRRSDGICTTYGRECDPSGGANKVQNTFKCGAVYNEACITKPASLGKLTEDAILEACRTAQAAVPFNKDRYQAKEAAIGEILRDCEGGASSPKNKERWRAACTDFKAQNEARKLQAAAAAQPVAPPPPPAPPVPAVAPAPAEPAQATTEPALAPPVAPTEIKPDCKALYGLAIEGTQYGDGTVEESFHQGVEDHVSAVAQFATQTTVIPPGTAPINLRVAKVGAQEKTLREKINAAKANVTDASFCSDKDLGQWFAQYISGGVIKEPEEKNMEETQPFSSGYRFSGDSSKITVAGSNGASAIDVMNADPLEGSGLLKKIDDMKNNCSNGSDQVVMISVHDHGMPGSKCGIQIGGKAGDGSPRLLTPEQFENGILGPLRKRGVKTIVNLDACFSGCFVDKLMAQTADGPNVCLMSATNSTSPSYSADGIIGRTYDVTYPHYLKALGNPYKAHVCAAYWDPVNLPQAAGLNGQGSSNANGSAADLAKEFKCASPPGGSHGNGGNSKFSPIKGIPGADEKVVRALMQCPQVSQLLEDFRTHQLKDTGLPPSAMSDWLSKIGTGTGGDTAPPLAGRAALQDALNSDSFAKMKQNCDIDLKQYAPKPAGGGRHVTPAAPVPITK